MPRMEGTFDEGKNKGRKWQVYADPGSKTGYTRKNFDPYDTSNDGGPTEYFEPFDMASADVDDRKSASKAATAAAKAAQRKAEDQDDDRRNSSFWLGVQQANERTYQEGVRQFDEGQGLKRDELGFRREDSERDDDDRREDLGLRRKQGNRELDLKEMDSRTRLQLGLRELELREREGGSDDLRAREKNVMDYLTTIGKLRLPHSELQALGQRAVAGIIPGQAAPAAALPAGGPGVAAAMPAGPGGALSADQWAALAQGVARDYEQRQIGQGSALSA